MNVTDEVIADANRDSMALVAAMARDDSDAVDLILSAANVPVMALSLAKTIVGMLSEIGIEDVSAHVQAWQHEWSAREARGMETS